MTSPQQAVDWAVSYLFQAAVRSAPQCFLSAQAGQCLIDEREQIKMAVSDAGKRVTEEFIRLFSIPPSNITSHLLGEDINNLEQGVIEAVVERCGKDLLCVQRSPYVRRSKVKIMIQLEPWARAIEQRFTALLLFLFLGCFILLALLTFFLVRVFPSTPPSYPIPTIKYNPRAADLFIATPANPL